MCVRSFALIFCLLTFDILIKCVICSCGTVRTNEIEVPNCFSHFIAVKMSNNELSATLGYALELV